jgi:hypothetical protein
MIREPSVYAEPKIVTDLSDCLFYHTVDLPGYGTVDGEWDLRDGVDEYLGHVSFQGKRVLELGTADGFLGFQMEQRGATVVSYDLSPEHSWDVVPYARVAYNNPKRNQGGDWVTDRAQFETKISRLNNAFWLSHRAFKSSSSMVYGDIYSIPEDIGTVDIATFGAILVHTRDPFRALERSAKLTSETIIVTETASRFGVPPAVGRLIGRLPNRLHRPSMRFIPDWRRGDLPDGWWQLSPDLIRAFLGVLGFSRSEATYHHQSYYGKSKSLFTIVAHRTAPI